VGKSVAMQSAATVTLMPLLIFCCVHRNSDSRCFRIIRTNPKIAHIPLGDLEPIYYAVPCTHPSLPSNRHLDRFRCFCRAHERDQQTDRHTDRDRSRYSVCSNRSHLAIAMMRPNNIKSVYRVGLCVSYRENVTGGGAETPSQPGSQNLVVSGDDDDADASAATLLDGVDDLLARRIQHPDHSDECAVRLHT